MNYVAAFILRMIAEAAARSTRSTPVVPSLAIWDLDDAADAYEAP